MFEVWVGECYNVGNDRFYGAFKTYQEARNCADEYMQGDEECYAYVVQDQGD